MSIRLSTIERAYELAKSGECESIRAIKDRLKAESYFDVDGQLYGPTLQADLRKLCRSATTRAVQPRSALDISGEIG